jgi:hypothetical protein
MNGNLEKRVSAMEAKAHCEKKNYESWTDEELRARIKELMQKTDGGKEPNKSKKKETRA